MPGFTWPKVVSMASTTRSDACRRWPISSGVLRARSRSSGTTASTISQLEKLAAQHAFRVGRQEGGLDADPAHAVAQRPDVRHRLLHGRDAAGEAQVQGGRPQAAQLLLEGLHGAADVGGALRLALAVDQRRQVAGGADRIHGLEEEEPVAAQQILDVVLGRSDQHVDAGVVEQRVEAAGIEGKGLADRRLGNGHGVLPRSVVCACQPAERLHGVSRCDHSSIAANGSNTLG